MKIRLDKYLADMQIGTRSQVKDYIRKKRIRVDGQVVTSPEIKIDTDVVCVTFDGKTVSYVEFEYFMLNKPAGTVSATSDKREKTVLDLIDTKNRKDLFPVGRLDKDTQGLLIITNDGALAHDLLSPKKHVDKTYFARVMGVVNDKTVQAFAEGIVIDDGVDERFQALPAKLIILTPHSANGVDGFMDGIGNATEDMMAQVQEVLITIHEGRFHQVKRMFAAAGAQVVFLKRLSMGPISLDEKLSPGEYRMLTQEEIQVLYAHKGMGS